MSDREDAFEVTYGCHNCGSEWSNTHPPKTTVGDSDIIGNVMVSDQTCNSLGPTGCDCCGVVTCPVCEMADEVYVEDRNPLKDID